MKTQVKRIESIVNSEFGSRNNIVSSIGEISELPYDDFDDLKNDIAANRAILRVAPMSRDWQLFSVVASPLQKILFWAALLMNVAMPVVSVISCFTISWFFLVLLILSPLAVATGFSKSSIAIWFGVATMIVWSMSSLGLAQIYWFSGLVTLSAFSGYKTRTIYSNVVLDSSMKSEAAFAFLYSTERTTLELPNGEILARYKYRD